jgi:hypothetical protein
MKYIILGLALASLACNPTPTQLPNGDTTQTVIINGGSGSPTSPGSEACLPVDRVRIVNFPSALTVGASAGIDVTPKDQFGNNRSDNCNEATGNRWTSNENVCLVACNTCFNTNVKGVSAGTCELVANVSGKTDGVKFSVN